MRESTAFLNVEHRDNIALLKATVVELRQPEPIAEFKADVKKTLAPHDVTKAVLDLEEIKYLSSSGFAMLINLAREVETAGGKLVLCSIHPDVQVGANIVGLPRLVPCFPNQHEALASLSP